MDGPRRGLIASVASIVLAASAAGAQTTDGTPAAKRFDATAYVGWFGADRGDIGGDTYRDWFSAPLGGVAVGHYWTDHLKTELELAFTGDGELTSGEQEIRGRLTRSTFRVHTYRLRTVSVLQSWQFLRNAWVHPFAGAGVDLNREQRRVDGSIQSYDAPPGSPPIFVHEPLPTERDSVWLVHAVVFTGVKAYFARHGYVRTDVRAGVGSGVDEVVWRFGVGFDF